MNDAETRSGWKVMKGCTGIIAYIVCATFALIHIWAGEPVPGVLAFFVTFCLFVQAMKFLTVFATTQEVNVKRWLGTKGNE